MNIFVLDIDPIKAAQAMDCVRVPKMVTESAQMMASALRRHGVTDKDFIENDILTKANRPYKGGYHRHPCSVWAGDTRSNYEWLGQHALALLDEYQIRFNKIHACTKPICNMMHMSYYVGGIFDNGLTPFAQAMPDEYKNDDPVVAYRAYYKSKTKSPGGVHYRHTNPPDWWEVTE